jgi:hypothetical protein
MTESRKRLLARAAFAVCLLVAMLIVRTYKTNRQAPSVAAPVSSEEVSRTQRQEEFRKKMADF